MLTGIPASIVLVGLGLSLLVILHELGHFIAAKWAGIKVEEFGLGYPPKAKKLFRAFGTDFTLNWIPFGGFVRMAGDAVDHTTIDQPKKRGEFYSVSRIKRLVVVFAGVFVNLVVGVMIFTLVYYRLGIPQPVVSPRITQVMPGSPAAFLSSSLPVDIVGFKFDGQLIETPTVVRVQEFVGQNRGKTVELITSQVCNATDCQPEQKSHELYIRTVKETPSGEGSLGVVFEQVVWLRYPWHEMLWRSAFHGLTEAFGLAYLILQSLGTMVTDAFKGKFQDQLAGPVGIVEQVHQAQIYESGWLARLSFVGMLSVNLALINVLPIPPLDGGKGLFTVLEWLLGKRRSLRLEQFVSYGGYFILFALILTVTFRDVWRIIVRL